MFRMAIQVMPFYPGEEGSLSHNTNISLDGTTPHIKEITFAGTYNSTYAGGDVVQVQKPNFLGIRDDGPQCRSLCVLVLR